MYTTIAIFSFIFSLLLYDCKKRSFSLVFVFSFLILLCVCIEGFRWQIGTDWSPYYTAFVINRYVFSFEFGYNLLMMFIHSISDSYTIFLIIIALIWYSALSNYIIKYSINPLMSLCLAYCLFIPYLGMNRQFIAMSITLSSIYFIFKRNLLSFIFLIALAMCFHRAALMFFPAYFLWGVELKKTQIICLVVAATIIGLIGVLNFLPIEHLIPLFDTQVSERLTLMIKASENASIISGVALRSVILIICFYVDIPQKYRETYTFFFNMYLMSVLIYVLFQSSPLRLFSARGGLFYSISLVVLVTYIVHFISKDKIYTMLCWCFIFAFYLYLMNRGIDGYVTGVGYDIFNPYKNILFPNGLF